MHATEEYCAVLESTLETVRTLAFRSQDREAIEVSRFCVRFGHIGYPSTDSLQIGIGAWLQPDRHPTICPSEAEAREALSIVACFHDDPTPGYLPPSARPGKDPRCRVSAYYHHESRILTLSDVDYFTPFELSIQFLHEGRHARQHLSEPYKLGIPPEDPELSESRTWAFHLNVLDLVGGDAWQRAVETEAAWLQERLRERRRGPGERFFGMSGEYCSALDEVFGPLRQPAAKRYRNLLVAMRANVLLAERAGLDRDTVYRNVVGRYYEWAKKQMEA